MRLRSLFARGQGSTSRRRPPLAKGLPIIGNLIPFMTDPLPHMVRHERENGSVFRIRIAHRKYTVICGNEAYELMNDRHGPLLSGPSMEDFAATLDTDRFIIALDGDEHAAHRRLLANSHARRAIEADVPTLCRLTDDFASSLRSGEIVDPIEPLKRLVTRMLGLSMAGIDSSGIFEDLQWYFKVAMNVTMMRTWPSFMLRHPRYLRAKRNLIEFTRTAIASRPDYVPEDERNIIDDLKAARDPDGRPLPEHVFVSAVIGTFLAGLDTVANSAAFGIYAILRDPDLHSRILAEIDEVFSDEVPTHQDLRKLTVMSATVNEVLRLYGVTVALIRTASRDFTVGGFDVAAGSDCMLYPAVEHFNPSVFSDPWTFDVDRFLEPRKEHRKMKGAYVPFGVGPHRCLGAAAGEVVLIALLGRLFNRVQLELYPRDYEVSIRMGPLRMPDKKFRVKVLGTGKERRS
jgi:cytochrome P450